MKSNKFIKGIENENLIDQYMLKNGCLIVVKRWKSFVAEIDRIYLGPKNKLYIFEIKSVPNFFLYTVISKKQKNRLGQLVDNVVELLPEYEIRAKLALVFPTKETSFLDL